MRLHYVSILIVILVSSSCSGNQEKEDVIVLGDTIQTASGLQYYYEKIGSGRKVEPFSKVRTYLSLMVNDSVIWNTDESPDSLFSFIADYTSLISGFSEVALLLREGDEIVAILPDSLAYGADGAGGGLIPPYATLVYDKFKVREVSEPRAILSDTLKHLLETEGLEVMADRHESITQTADSLNYHIDYDQFYSTINGLFQDEKYGLALDMSDYFATKTGEDGFRWYRVLSYENLGRIELARDSLKALLKTDTAQSMSSAWRKLEELEQQLQ